MRSKTWFPRIEVKKENSATVDTPKRQPAEPRAQKNGLPEVPEGVISFAQFRSVQLVVARIIGAEQVPKSERLLKLHVKAPDERTIVAGIAQFYAPSELKNKNIVIVANLKPAKLMGIESQGMALTAQTVNSEGEKKLVLLTVDSDVAPGSSIA